MNKFRSLTIVGFVFISCTGACLPAQAAAPVRQAQDSLQYFFSEARKASAAGDHAKFYSMIGRAYSLHPYHPSILYQHAIASAVTGRADESLSFLKKAVIQRADVDMEKPEFASLKSNPGFEEIARLRNSLAEKVVTSDTAFVIPDRSLHLECVAAGKEKGSFYMGSIHKRKIIYRDSKGTVKDFTSAAQDGLTSVFGIKVDGKSNVLWACASPMKEMENYDSTAQSFVFKYDLKTGKLIQRYTTTTRMENVFGDLALAPDGNVYVSDSRNNIIFRVNEKNKSLEEFVTSKDFWNLQGITFNSDGSVLFIADYIKGIFRYDVQKKSLSMITQGDDVCVKSVDGLAFYNNTLIAIQNAVSPMRVTRFYLDTELRQISRHTYLDKAHPAFNEPTIGCLQGDAFYYIANSAWSGYTEESDLKPLDQLADVVILRNSLSK